MLALSLSAGVAVASNAMNTDNGQMDMMKAKIAKMEAVLDQNQGQAYSFADLPLKNWEKRVTISGVAAADATWSRRTQVTQNANGTIGAISVGRANINRFAGDNKQGALDLNSANIMVDAEVNCYTTVHMNIGWANGNDLRAVDHPVFMAANNATPGSGLFLDEGYITISNFAKTPVYFRVGKQNLDFGTYYRGPITASMTQLLSETQGDAAATLGYVDASGLSGSVYVFKGANVSGVAPAGRNRLNNGGVHLQYAGSYNNVGFKLDADYINNIGDSYALNTANGAANRAGGLSLHADARYGQFDGSADWVMALSSLSNVTYNDNTLLTATTSNNGNAKPKALALDFGYSFNSMGLPSRAAIGYQHSWQALGAPIPLPRSRWIAQYGVELGRNTDFTLQYIYDKDYSDTTTSRYYNGTAVINRMGTGNNASTVVARLGVRFA